MWGAKWLPVPEVECLAYGPTRLHVPESTTVYGAFLMPQAPVDVDVATPSATFTSTLRIVATTRSFSWHIYGSSSVADAPEMTSR